VVGVTPHTKNNERTDRKKVAGFEAEERIYPEDPG